MSVERDLDTIQARLIWILKGPCADLFPTVCLCLGATGPLYAGYMLAGGYSWRLYFYVVLAFAVALFMLAFVFVEETAYKREEMKARFGSAITPPGEDDEKVSSAVHEYAPAIPPRRSFISTLKPWSSIDKDAPFFLTAIRSFSYFLVPQVFWVVTTYGKLALLFLNTSFLILWQVFILVLVPWPSITLSQSSLSHHLTAGLLSALA